MRRVLSGRRTPGIFLKASLRYVALENLFVQYGREISF
jgi:hypothetical protein